MSKKLFVGNLSYNAEETALKELFAAHGEVESVNVVRDPEGRSRGFGFVVMIQDDSATNAINALNGIEFLGRKLNVSEARPKSDSRPPFRDGGSRGGGGGYGGGGGGGGRRFGGGGGGGGGRGRREHQG